MSAQKHLWFWIVIAIALAVMTATALLLWKQAEAPAAAPSAAGTVPENVRRAEEAAKIQIEVPSANPLDKVTANPIEGANPFKDIRTNPFR